MLETPTGDYSYCIYNATGCEVDCGSFQNRTSIDISGWQPGIYLVQVNSSESSHAYIRKLVIY